MGKQGKREFVQVLRLMEVFAFEDVAAGVRDAIDRGVIGFAPHRASSTGADMGWISMATRDELVVALAGRYASGSRKERGQILDEFAAVSGLHRKHAMRLLRAGQANRRFGPRPARRLYNDATRDALTVIWEASDRVCGKRLRPLVPILIEAMERHGHLHLALEVRTGLLGMSAATIDRVLRDVRERAGGRKRRHAPPSAAIRRSVPVRTFDDWGDSPPGFVEADLVAHSGPTAKGSYVQTLTLTDIATGWTECAPMLVREQKLLTEVLSAMRERMPFALLGFDTDNDSVFMNETVKTYCDEAGLVSRAVVPIARTTRPGSSRRTAPWSGVPLVTGATRDWTRRRRWHGCTRRCGCS